MAARSSVKSLADRITRTRKSLRYLDHCLATSPQGSVDRRVRRWARLCFRRRHSAAEISAHAGLSARTINRHLHVYGFSLCEYLALLRLNAALDAADDGCAVAAMAATAGLTESSLYRLVRKHLAATPSALLAMPSTGKGLRRRP